MYVIENECVGCTSLGLPCLGSTCSNRSVVRFYCNECGEEISEYEEEEHDGLCQWCREEEEEED